MIPFVREPDEVVATEGLPVARFSGARNIDPVTVNAFGEEWSKFRAFTPDDIEKIGDEYFDIVPPALLTSQTVVLDAGCGSGRWSRYLSSRVSYVEAIDPSEAVFVAATQHADLANIRFTQAGIDVIPFADESFDMVVCLGVLHHIPDTAAALRSLIKKLRPGGHLLLYLYYSLDNRHVGYRGLFGASNLLRVVISSLSGGFKRPLCDAIALLVYLPLVLLARAVGSVSDSMGDRLPLGYYRNKSFHVMRNDALDRFGTPLEKRFSRAAIQDMLSEAGMTEVVFSEHAPFWHCLSQRAD